MKLTKDMLDFEKYDYFAGSTFSGKDPVDVFHAGAWVPPVDGACMYELARALKPKPRYILVLEAHMMQHAEDSRLGDALRASGINAADALAVQALYATAGQSGSHRIVSALRAVEAWTLKRKKETGTMSEK